MALSGTGYHNLFLGTYEEAVANGDNRDNWIAGYQNDAGKWEFRIPLTEGVNYMPIVAISQSYLEKYEAGQNPLARAFYPRQAEVDLEAATLVTGDYENIQEITVTNNVKMFKVSGASLDTVGGPNSNGYKTDLLLVMGSDSFDKAYIGTAEEAAAAAKVVEIGENKTFALQVRWIRQFGQPETIETLIGEPIVMSFHSVSKDAWYERVFTINETEGTLTIDPVPAIDSQTEEVTLKKGETIILNVKASGVDLTYQWQYSKDGGTTWTNCKSTGYNAATFSFNATAGMDGRLYRCVVTGAGGTVDSEPIPVKVSTLAITAQPKDTEVGKGQTVDMTVKASGKDLTYQWQYSKDNGETWVDCKSAGYDTAALSFKGTATMNGRLFRCVVTDGYGFTEASAEALVKVSTTVITSSPADAVVTTGKKVTFAVTATGTDLTYQWQYSKNNGKTWVDCHSTGYDTATLSFKASATMNGRLFRCVVTGSDGIAVASGAGALTITDTAITAQPADVTVAAGKKATFKVTATGEELTYQWQYSKNGGKTWIDCTSAGHDSATFSFKPSATLDGRLYRCIVTGSDGVGLPSNAATLTVN